MHNDLGNTINGLVNVFHVQVAMKNVIFVKQLGSLQYMPIF